MIIVWTSEQNKANIRSSHSANMVNHLIECSLQQNSTKQRALQEKETKKTRSPQKQTISLTTGHTAVDGIIPALTIDNLTTFGSGSPVEPSWPRNLDPQNRYHPYPTHIRSSSPIPSGSQSASIIPDSIHPSDSISIAMGSRSRHPSLGSAAGRSLSRRGSGIQLAPLLPAAEFIPWTKERKKNFERRVLRLTASAGFPLSWIENPEWGKLCDEFIPGAPHISRKVLTTRILGEVVSEFRAEAKRQCSGKEATMQSDGWTGVNNHHLVAFMITIHD